MSNRNKGIKQINLTTGKVINIFKSISEAVKTLGISDNNIASCANEKRHSAHGFAWAWVNDKEMEQVLSRDEHLTQTMVTLFNLMNYKSKRKVYIKLGKLLNH